MKTIKIKIPATTANFGSGFDSFGAALDLYNEIEVTEIRAPKNKKYKSKDEIVKIDITGEGKDTLPRDERNIVWQAMKKVFDICNTPLQSYHLRLTNNIPLASGLGSSAAATLGGLLIANKICYNKNLSNEEILKLAVELEGHPDNIVPAFVGGFCICYSVPQKNFLAVNNQIQKVSKEAVAEIKYSRIKMPPDLKAVVCVPEFELSTKFARKILPKSVQLSDAVFNLSRSALFVASVLGKDYRLIKYAMDDKLHQRQRAKYIPGIDKVFENALKSGAYGVAISGAGPSILAISSYKNSRRVAVAMERGFDFKNIKSRSFILNFSNSGAEILCH